MFKGRIPPPGTALGPNTLENHNPEPDSGLLIVTALLPEATPLIELFQLKPEASTPFRLFSNRIPGKRASGNRFFSHRSVTLLVTGIGELAATAATAATLARMGPQTIAINIGVAGAEQNLGDLFFANSIEKYGQPIAPRNDSMDSNRSGFPVFYPHPPFRPRIPSLRVGSVVHPCTDYQTDICFDMEAYGFCSAARRFLDSEHIHSLKIISDTPQSPLETNSCASHQSPGFSPETISKLIKQKTPEIEAFATQLYQTCDQQRPDVYAQSTQTEKIREIPLIAEFLHRVETENRQPIHFSVTELRQLKRLAERFQALDRKPADERCISKIHTGREVIKLLETSINQHLPLYEAASDNSGNAGKNLIPEQA